MMKQWLLVLCVATGCLSPAAAAGLARHVVLVVWDGMRPDFVSPELTPALWQLRTNGTWFARHHSAYPTSTEVNGATLATGAYPRHSGILANLEFRPALSATRAFGTEELSIIRAGDGLMQGRYLAVPTLPELLHAQHRPTTIAGTKPVAVFFDRAERDAHNATGRSCFGTNSLPSTLWPELVHRLGPPPESAAPNFRRDEWTTRCLTEQLWADEVPPFSVLWLSEPDLTQHKHGPGTPAALEAIRGSDQNFARLMGELDRRGLRGQTDVMVVSDHGFSTVDRSVDVVRELNRSGLKVFRSFTNAPQPGDTLLVVNGGSLMLYVTGRSADVIQRTVAALQTQNCAGVIFTRAGLPGTFPLHEVRLDAPHAPDVVVSLRWSSAGAGNGTPGLLTRDGVSGASTLAGMHTSLAPTDLHNLCVAGGPDFRTGFTNTIATGNIDVMPTLSWVLGVKAADADGRVLFGSLKSAADTPPRVEHKKLAARASLPQGNWSQYLSITEVNGVRYFEEGSGELVPAKPR